MARRLRKVLLLLAAATLGALLAVSVGPAQADTSVADNPWQHAMTDPGNGLVIVGDDGPQNDAALLVEDHLNQPIFAVLEAGGAAVLGDQFRVLDSGLYPRITLSASPPDQSVCTVNGLLWIGGPGGGIWRCADLGGGFGWWLVA